MSLRAPLLAVVLLLAPSARAADDRYEARLVEGALVELQRTPDPAPEGKRIRHIVIVSRDIIAPEDPYPRILNAVHATTRPNVIRRELLFEEGQPYRASAADETERNLRALFILAMARVVPLQTNEPDTVDVLVVTRDLWSIRFNSSFNLVGSLLQYLRLRPTEQNLFGRDKQLSLDFELRLDTMAFGQQYVDRRLFGTRLGFGEAASIVLNRSTGAAEGTEGALNVTRPLYSLQTDWGFEVEGRWSIRRARLFRGATVWELPVADGVTVPHVYDRRELDATAFYTRSDWTSSSAKLDLSPGIGGYAHRYLAPAGLSDAQLEVLRARVLPRSEAAAYLALRLRAWTPEFRVLHDVQTFALSEDYQNGPNLRAEVRLANPAGLVGGAPFTEGWASFRQRWVVADSLTSATVAGSVRYVMGSLDGDERWLNRRFAAELLHVSPFVGPGRFALRGLFEVREQDLDRTTLLLGGGNGLRGVAPEALAGTRMAVVNVEYRSRPWEVLTLHAGFVLFYDAGTAWSKGERFKPWHTVGIGLRALFPQFDVEPFRLDIGWVLSGEAPDPLQRFSSSFGQVSQYRPKMLDRPFE